ncbi:MAG: hypothetical protein JWM99_1094 [Verrucomicrobiales bacterium]|nr:hypothetical protein [Verrucomicrobiales bacterium]
MNNALTRKIFGLLCIAGVAGYQARATSVFVSEVGVSPSIVVDINTSIYNGSTSSPYNGGAYAGLNELMVGGTMVGGVQTGGTLTYGFCIDPFHYSSTAPLEFQYVPLADAPLGKFPHPMGVSEATEIEKLWTYVYSDHMTPLQAAGLQLAIWEVVGTGNGFSVTGPGSVVTQAADYRAYVTDHFSAIPNANLIGLTGPGQDYVVALVPDRAKTAALLGLSFMGLAAARRRFKTKAV